MDEIHRQLLAWLRGGKRQHSMLSCWELMLLAVHAAPPKLETAEAVANTAAVVARARSYPAIASLAAMTHRLLAQPSPSVQRQRVSSKTCQSKSFPKLCLRETLACLIKVGPVN